MNFKKICLAGSMSVVPKILEVQAFLKERNFEVETPSLDEPNDAAYSSISEAERAKFKYEMYKQHLERIRTSDALLVVNENLKGIEGYIGANTFLEMGMAFALGKPILLLNSIPEQANRDEILGLYPKELKGDLDTI